uniref:Uncharacterized protein n=1 Tax=Opuntia streptacantha TaxID=393608 RepID=A0A7C9E0Z7_OPUST
MTCTLTMITEPRLLRFLPIVFPSFWQRPCHESTRTRFCSTKRRAASPSFVHKGCNLSCTSKATSDCSLPFYPLYHRIGLIDCGKGIEQQDLPPNIVIFIIEMHKKLHQLSSLINFNSFLNG